jgi:hypothetical protein
MKKTSFAFDNDNELTPKLANDIYFVYTKDNKIKVLNLEKSQRKHYGLIQDGWRHTETINICSWLEHLHNVCEESEVYKELKSISIRS